MDKDLLYSRQIAEIGEKTMGQLSNLHILIIGQKSVGFECSKCMTLMGIGNIYLFDNDNSQITIGQDEVKYTNRDLFGLNFGINATLKTLVEERKYSISELTSIYLKTLNPFIQIHHNKVNQSLNSFMEGIKNELDLIIITDFYKIKLNEFYNRCISKNQKVILGFTLGYYGLVHTNFINHNVYDMNGEPKHSSYLSNSKLENNLLKGQIEKNNLFSSSDKLKIYVNDQTFQGKVIKCNLDQIEIELTSSLEITGSIYLEEEKELYKPVFQDWNIIKNDISHWNILSLGQNKYPLNKVLEFINKPLQLSHKKDLNYEDCTLFSELYPMGAIVGGILAQEAIKLTGKYIPMEQSLFIDGSIMMPTEFSKLKTGNFSHIENLLEKETINKIKNSNIFMIGAGALGCEHAKNLVMMNGFTAKYGKLTITDPDTISLSNLNRQFLFQSENIGDFKSKVIQEKLSSYFPKSKLKFYTDPVSKETYKTVFRYDHWKTSDILLGALDNHEARLYIDKMAVKFDKPLFESGTQGTKCHTQTILPYKTITYGEIEDPPQESIPMCTIKNFPNNYTHCIEWALEAFHLIFSQTINDLIEIKKDSCEWLKDLESQNNNIIYDRISKVNLFLKHINKPKDKMISGIIQSIYNDLFIEPISVILNSFPEDLEENGEKFWGGKRKRPQIIPLENSSSATFIEGMKEILQVVLGIDTISDISLDEETEPFDKPIEKFTLEELEKNKSKEINSEVIAKLKQELKEINLEKLEEMELKSIEFDKDDDFTLGIMDLLAKQRANCYGITVGNRNETRKIAGRIIPALSTTTTIVSGFVMLELIKYFNGKQAFDYNINIGINQYIGFETSEAPVKCSGMFEKAYNQEVIVYPENITRWDKFVVSVLGDAVDNIFSLVEHLKSEFPELPIDMITLEKEIIYSSDMKKPMSIKLNGKIHKPKNIGNLEEYWTKYNIEYNDCLVLNIFSMSRDSVPILTKPIYFYH